MHSPSGVTLRLETAADNRAVEELTREAFWDLYVPGCSEHYLVHLMRTHEDFLADLSLVAELRGQIVGSIMTTRSHLSEVTPAVAQGAGPRTLPTLTFGPLCVNPEHQHQGIGKKLSAKVAELGKQQGYAAVIIHGDPHNYVGSGFRNGKDYQVSANDGSYPLSLLVKELTPGVLGGARWKVQFSPVFEVPGTLAEFDATFPPRPSIWRPSQELFSMLSRARLPQD